MTPEFLRDLTHTKRFWTRNVQGEGRGLAVSKRAEAPGIGVSLPDDVHVRHAERDRASLQNSAPYINQDSIAQLHGIVQPQNRYLCSPARRSKLKHALPAEHRLSIL